MSELNKTLTVQALEEGIEEEIEAEGHAFVTEPELDDVMRGYDIGVETGEGLIERLCGERGWSYREVGGGFAVAGERWKLNNMEQYAEKDVNEDYYGGASADPSEFEDMW